MTLPLVPYVRVSTIMQEAEGHSLDAQLSKIAAWATYSERELFDAVIEQASAKDTRRPGLQSALAAMEAGVAGGIVVTKLDRLSRSVADFSDLLMLCQKRGWELHILDLQVDLNSAIGKLIAQIIAAVAEFEREMISERTKVGMAAARDKGVTLGRPRKDATKAAA